ncbi:MAG TPA: hypothetical protein VN680_04430 [Burkholderiaceae bacterium]|nr:hypothetical protein [Burkholderiaceae bacterium]
MATPNYSYEKRQRELAKKRKKEEKLQRKAERGAHPQPDQSGAEGEPQSTPPPAEGEGSKG